ncbi:hypothetical protein FKM82_022905 [Ascaphus truei]
MYKNMRHITLKGKMRVCETLCWLPVGDSESLIMVSFQSAQRRALNVEMESVSLRHRNVTGPITVGMVLTNQTVGKLSSPPAQIISTSARTTSALLRITQNVMVKKTAAMVLMRLQLCAVRTEPIQLCIKNLSYPLYFYYCVRYLYNIDLDLIIPK